MAGLSAAPRHALACRQVGLTFWSALYVLITLGLIAFVAARSGPVYFNNRGVSKRLYEVAQGASMPHAALATIRNAVSRHFNADYASGRASRDVEIERDGASRLLRLRYEMRRPLAFNLSLADSFDEQARMGRSGS